LPDSGSPPMQSESSDITDALTGRPQRSRCNQSDDHVG